MADSAWSRPALPMPLTKITFRAREKYCVRAAASGLVYSFTSPSFVGMAAFRQVDVEVRHGHSDRRVRWRSAGGDDTESKARGRTSAGGTNYPTEPPRGRMPGT